MTPWALPETATIGGTEYELHTDYRDILEIMGYLDDPDTPEYLRWRIAVALFFEGEMPAKDMQESMEYLAAFISCGEKDSKPGPKLLDWEQDAKAIIADVNKVAGREIRSLPYLHWWTFLAYFQAIGEGQLSTIVSIRDKLRRGKKLEKWEQDYYRENKSRIDFKKKYSAEDLAEQERLKKLLGE
ncbi:MAG: hypothetical protein E7453_06000 [Ruminococcaceae bacterium]|nr:hypothetical protein [Oscillospiraceae bacterium]